MDIYEVLGLNDEQEQQNMQQEEEKQEEKKQQVAGDKQEPPKTQEQQAPSGQNVDPDMRAIFRQATGQDYDPSNPQHVYLAVQLQQQIENQKRVMEWLKQAVDPEFDAWLEEKVKTLPYAEVAEFQAAIQNGDLPKVQQWITQKKQEYLTEKSGGQKGSQQVPIQAEDKKPSEDDYSPYGDILTAEELEAIKNLM